MKNALLILLMLTASCSILNNPNGRATFMVSNLRSDTLAIYYTLNDNVKDSIGLYPNVTGYIIERHSFSEHIPTPVETFKELIVYKKQNSSDSLLYAYTEIPDSIFKEELQSEFSALYTLEIK